MILTDNTKQILQDIKYFGGTISLKDDNLKLSFPDDFSNPDLLERIKINKSSLINFLVNESRITPTLKQTDFKATPGQKGLWFLSQFEEGSNAYHIATVFDLIGKVNPNFLEKSFQILMDRHEILRTTFYSDEEGELYQQIHEKGKLNLAFNCFEEHDFSKQEELIKTYGNALFDLGKDSLFRSVLIKIDEKDYILSLTFHHIISDGWSVSVLIKELLHIYDQLSKGGNVVLPELKIQYKDYALWLRDRVSKMELSRSYWKDKLSGELPTLDLLGYQTRPPVKTYVGNRVLLSIDKLRVEKWKETCKENNATLFMGLLSGLNAILYRYTSQQDFIIGTAITGRIHQDVINQIGFYVNTLPLRTKVTSESSFLDLLSEVKETTLEAFEHQEYPFNTILEDIDIIWDASRSPLFDCILVLQNNEKIDLKSKGLKVIQRDNISKTSKYDLSFDFTENNDGELNLRLEYNTDIFQQDFVKRLGTHYVNMMNTMVVNENLPICSLEYLSEQEKHQLLFEFNDTKVDYPKDKTIVELFEEQVEKYPNNIAVVFEDVELTYTELNEKANQLGQYLREKYNIQADDLIGIKLGRSEQMIVAILGILKSGAAYVPIDPSYPQERIDYIEKDSNCKVVIDIEELKRFNEVQQRYLKSNMETIITPQNLAYVIYTSGTTGNPKGVMIKHSNVVRLLKTDKVLFDFKPDDVWTMFHSYCFDFSVWEMYGALFNGSKLVIISLETARNPIAFLNILIKERVTILNQTPSNFYNLLLEELNRLSSELSLRFIIFGGEALNPQKLSSYVEKYPRTKLVNMYGITETTVHVTYKEITIKEIENNISNIGLPIPTLSCYILDENQNLSPIGVPGELYVGGEGLAKGYLNRDDLTSEKFIKSPFIKGETLYRSGDIVKVLKNGELEYLGRNDHQVKIRGFRIELGEIETAISQYSGEIQQVIVEAKEINQDKALVAYYVSKSEIDKSEIRSYLQNKLPEYMVPGYYVEVESFPLTPNGKVDRKLLPSITGEDIIKKEYVAPRNKEEQLIVDAWALVLKQEVISVKDSFYNLGGDSIKSIQVASRLKQKGYTLKIESILRNPIIEDLAKLIQQDTSPISQDMVKGNVVLTPIQRFFFESKQIPNKNHYNQSVLLKSKAFLNESFLKETITILVKHHDALRMRYEFIGDAWQQYNLDDSRDCYKISFFDLRESTNPKEELHRLGEELQSSFTISSGPLFHIGHFRMDDGDRLALIIHHLVVDGVSWRILLEDFSTIYQSLETNSSVQLPLKTDSFQKWASFQESYAKSPVQQQERAYWENLSQVSIPLLHRDFEDADNKAVINKSLSFALDIELTQKLQTKVHHLYNTEINDVLLTALALGIKETFGLDKSVVKMEGHGREEIIDGVDIGRTVGWFTSVYPFVLDISNKQDLEIVSVKEYLRKVPNKGIGYGILKYLDTSFEKELSPSIQFNYLGDFGSNVEGIDDSLFEFSSENIGSSIDIGNIESEVLLDVSGIMVSGQLSMSISYSNSLFKQDTIEKLILSYQEQLCKLIKELSETKLNRLTPSDLTFKGVSVEDLFRINSDNTIEDIYKLSPLQQSIYYHWLSEKSTSMYFEQMSYRIKAPELDIDSVKESYDKLLSRHGVLRTSFTYDLSDQPLQIVRKTVPSNFSYQRVPYGVSVLDYLEEVKLKDRKKGFNLDTPSQMRLQVLDLENGEFEFIWSHHHILTDGWCMSILIKDFYQILNSVGQKVPLNLPKPFPYSNYIQWLDKVNTDDSLAYWKDYLTGYSHVAKIPFTMFSTEDAIYEPSKEVLKIDGALNTGINKLCNQIGITQNTFIQAVWGYLLSKYNNTQDVIFGSVVSGRPGDLEGIEDMVGLFINTIPVRVQYSDGTTILELLRQVQDQAISSSTHHYLNLSEVQSQSELGMNLINHIMVYENYPMQDVIKEDVANQRGQGQELTIESIDVFEQTNYDFEITISSLFSSLVIEFKYNSNKYDAKLIKNLVGHLNNLIAQFIASPEQSLNTLSYLNPLERHQLLVEFNDTKVDYPKDKTIVDLFEEQIEKTPNNVAIVFEEKKLTYRELNEKANQLASYLREKYVIQPDDLVGIKLERSERMIVALLGILKSGAAYVPIDVNYPDERIAYIVQDSNCKVVIDEQELNKFYEVQDGYSITNLVKIYEPHDLAYMIYTSGSTGNPKGVMIEHTSLVNRLEWMQKVYSLSEHDVILQKTNYSFDVSVWELFWWMYNGSKLSLLSPEGQKDPEEIINNIEQNKISVLHFVPSMLSVFLDYLKQNNIDKKRLNSLKQIFVSGEALQVSQNNNFFDEFSTVSLINLYGPTEATIDVSYFKCSKDLSLVPIGKPIDNTQLYILDSDMKPVPIGVLGKLYIAGVGVARGYLNQPDLTEKKFVPNPFKQNTVIYDTGDLARWLLDGNIEFLGRDDYQVKIRGHRIELDEIETVSAQYSNQIKQVIADVRKVADDLALVLYIKTGTPIDKSKLKNFLRVTLPEYMIPSYFIEMESFSLLSNGKINRKALPDVNAQNFIQKGYVAPRNKIEESLVECIAKVLGCEENQIGIHDNFFDLGMNSLKLIRLINIIKKEYDLLINIPILFEFPNISELSDNIHDLIDAMEEKVEESNSTLSEEIDDFLNYFSN